MQKDKSFQKYLAKAGKKIFLSKLELMILIVVLIILVVLINIALGSR